MHELYNITDAPPQINQLLPIQMSLYAGLQSVVGHMPIKTMHHSLSSCNSIVLRFNLNLTSTEALCQFATNLNWASVVLSPRLAVSMEHLSVNQVWSYHPPRSKQEILLGNLQTKALFVVFWIILCWLESTIHDRTTIVISTINDGSTIVMHRNYSSNFITIKKLRLVSDQKYHLYLHYLHITRRALTPSKSTLNVMS